MADDKTAIEPLGVDDRERVGARSASRADGERSARVYGVEAIMKDGLGNWFRMTQPKDA